MTEPEALRPQLEEAENEYGGDSPLPLDRLRGLHRREGGQSLVLVALVLFTLVAFLAFTVNVGHRINAKVEMQNAADAAVLSGALWNARGLNMISILNVGLTECLALIIMFRAFDKTLTYTKLLLPINELAAEALFALPEPVTSAIGFAWQICLKYIRAVSIPLLEKINSIMQRFVQDGSGLWRVMKIIMDMEKIVEHAMPIIGYREASRIADLNGADAIASLGGVSLNAILLPADFLPVKDGEFKDLCRPTKEGGSGYTNFLCWQSALGMTVPVPGIGGELRKWIAGLWAVSTVCVIPPPAVAWFGFIELEYLSLCGGAPAGGLPGIEQNAKTCAECEENNGRARWSRGIWEEISKNEFNYLGGTGRTGKVDRPPCTNVERRVRTEDCSCSEADCDIGCDLRPDGTSPSRGKRRIYEKRERVLISCFYTKEGEVPEYSMSTDEYYPLMLADDWKELVDYTGIVFQGVKSKFPWIGSDDEAILSQETTVKGELVTFGEEGDSSKRPGENIDLYENIYSFGCARIYNPTDQDLFNQDWHVKLTKCDAETMRNSLRIGPYQVPAAVTDFLRHAGAEEVILH